MDFEVTGAAERKEAVYSGLLKSAIESGKVIDFTVEGTSMAPFLRPGDTVILKDAYPPSLRIGDTCCWIFMISSAIELNLTVHHS